MEAKTETKTIDLPKTIRTAVYEQFGSDPKLVLVKEIAMPVPQNNDVLVRVYGASINPIDYKFLAGNYTLVMKTPFYPGFDIGGVIVKVGSNVRGYKVGDEIMGYANYSRCSTMAEYAVIDSRAITKKPKNLSCAQASTLPLAGLTSYQSLLKGGINKSSKVLILGGSGGTGALGVQFAKHGFGAHTVACTCSVATNGDWLKSLGADQVIDYKTEKWWEVLKGQNFDIVYDCVGGYEAWQMSARVLKPTGSFVTICGDKGGKLGIGKLLSVGMSSINRKFWSLFGNPNYGSVLADNKRADQLDVIRQWVEDGKVKNVLEKTFSLDEVADLFALSISGRTRGKAAIVFLEK